MKTLNKVFAFRSIFQTTSAYCLLIVSVCLLIGCEKRAMILESVMELQGSGDPEVNVLMFQDSAANDRDMIQMAIDYAKNNHIHNVFVPDGTYQINAVGTFLQSGILLRDSTRLRLSNNAILKAIPNSSTHYSVVTANGVSNATIEGGAIQGERYEHTGTTGEGGMAITIANASKISVKDITLKDCWGDGIYIRNSSKQITVDNVIADNNRRQGMSVVAVDGLLVTNSIWKNTNGTNPMAGIDLEPNNINDTVKNVQIINNQFLNNQALGLHIWGRHGPVHDVQIKDCVMSGSPVGLSIRHGYTSDITVEDVEILGSTTRGVMIGDNAKQINMDSLKVTTADGIGVRIENSREVEMRNLDVRAHTSVISLNKDTLITIENAKLKSMVNHVGNGLYTANCGNMLIDSVEVEGCNYGFNITSNTNITVSNTTVTGCQEFGMWFSNTHFSNFINNTIHNTSQVGFRLVGSDNTISNNELKNNGFLTNNTYAQALFESNTLRNTISGNIFKTSTVTNKPKYAIHLSSTKVKNNTGTGNVYEANSWVTATVQNDGTGNTINP